MLQRMTVARCCCDVVPTPPPETITAISWRYALTADEQNNPIDPWGLVTPLATMSLFWISDGTFGIGATRTVYGVVFPLPALGEDDDDYTDLTVTLYPGFTDPAQAQNDNYDIHVVPTRFGIQLPRDLGPSLPWDQSGATWQLGDEVETPNIASLVNPVIRDPAYGAPEEILVLFHPNTQFPEQNGTPIEDYPVRNMFPSSDIEPQPPGTTPFALLNLNDG